MTSFEKLGYERITDEQADASPLIAFASREQYLAWVVEWKAALCERIKLIREKKAIRGNRELEGYLRYRANNHRQHLRVECANLMALRMAAKRHARQQVEAARAGRGGAGEMAA